MGVIIYKEEVQNFEPVAFLKDISNQVKIRDIKDGQELNKCLAVVMIKIIFFSGIKEKVEEIHKADINKMILNYYKHLSLNEITYAFELERYGKLGEKIQHFQLFDASYMSSVISKYEKFKTEKRVEYKLNKPIVPTLPELTQSQKDEIVFLGIIQCYNDFILGKIVPSTKIYYYDFLFKRGFLPKDAPTKNAVSKIACENIKNRVNFTKEDHLMNQIINKDGSKSNELIIECKRISLERFFNQFRNESQLKTKLKL